MTCPTQRPASFAADRSGSVSMLFGLLALVFFALIGAAVDYSRWANMKGKTAAALDAALLAGGRALQTQMTPAEAIDVAKKNFAANAQSLNIINPQVTIEVGEDGQSLTGIAWAKMSTPFLGLVKTKSLKVAANSKVGFSIGSTSGSGGGGGGGSDLEISLMLDVTGSMCANNSGPCNSGPKIDAMKVAATDLVEIILRATGSNPQAARIALVPFNGRVRVGAYDDSQAENLMRKLTDLDKKWSGWYKDCPNSTWSPGATSETSGIWSCGIPVPKEANNWKIMPCVTDRTGPQALTDAAPGPDAWLNAHEGSRFPLSNDSSDAPYSWNSGWIGDKEEEPADQWNYGGDCSEVSPNNAVMPLTANKTDLQSRINGLVAEGPTGGALGTAWSWYVLSPNWSSVFNGQNAPGSYSDTVASGSNPPKLRKIAVLMTDGVYNTERGWKDADDTVVSNNAKQICTNMKTAGVEIYTVGFDLDSLSADKRARAQDVLQTCGTDIHHFYDALNAEQLKSSFRDIALQLSQLFVAK